MIWLVRVGAPAAQYGGHAGAVDLGLHVVERFGGDASAGPSG